METVAVKVQWKLSSPTDQRVWEMIDPPGGSTALLQAALNAEEGGYPQEVEATFKEWDGLEYIKVIYIEQGEAGALQLTAQILGEYKSIQLAFDCLLSTYKSDGKETKITCTLNNTFTVWKRNK